MQNSARSQSRTFLWATLLFFASLSVTGQNKVEEPGPLSDKEKDLSLQEVVLQFESRLPPEDAGHAAALGKKLMQLSRRYRFSPGLLLALIETESSFQPRAVSRAGAVGLMQVLPSTAFETARRYRVQGLRNPEDLKDPYLNLELGVAYLAYLRKRFERPSHYLAAYNLGPASLELRIRQGRFEFGPVAPYVRKIQSRTLRLREAVQVAAARETVTL